MTAGGEPLTPPLIPRPAATIVLVRESAHGAHSAHSAHNAHSAHGAHGAHSAHGSHGMQVFLMRRHSEMHFAPGVMVFPGGGVDDRDRNPAIAWSGPEPSWWARRFGIDNGLAEALVCTAVRETFEESGVLFAGPADDPRSIVADACAYSDSRRALSCGELSFADFLHREKLVLRADLLRPWANWVTPEAERTRRYDTYFFVGALPAGQRADGQNTESDLAGWVTPEAALEDFAAGRTLLLPPTWTQLDSLVGHTVAEVLTVERRIAAVQADVTGDGDNFEVEFFDSDRYKRAGGRWWV